MGIHSLLLFLISFEVVASFLMFCYQLPVLDMGPLGLAFGSSVLIFAAHLGRVP